MDRPQTATWHRGMRRLALATGVPYFSFWILVFISNIKISNDEQRLLSRHPEPEMQSIYLKVMMDAETWITRSIIWGLIIPFALLVISAVALWVYRGFRPRS